MPSVPFLEDILRLAEAAKRSGNAQDYKALVDAEVEYLRAKEKELGKSSTLRQLLHPDELDALVAREDPHTYVAEWRSTCDSLRSKESLLYYIDGLSEPKYRANVLRSSGVMKWMGQWDEFSAASTATIDQLEESSLGHPELPRPTSLSVILHRTLVELRQRLTRDSAFVQLRGRGGANSRELYLSSNAELSKWCRKKSAQLDQAQSFESLRDGPLSTFVDASHKMEMNFLRLLQNCRQLGTSRSNVLALEDSNHEWASYTWTLCERLRRCVLDFSKNSLTYDKWRRTEGPRTVEWLRKVERFLQPNDPKDKQGPQDELFHRRCAALLREVETFNLLATHMSELPLREAALQPHYKILSEELLSKTSAAALSTPSEVEDGSPLDAAIDQLQDWIGVHDSTRVLGDLRALGEQMRLTADPLVPAS